MNKAFFTVTVFAVQIVSATLAFGAEPLSVMSFGGSYQEAQRKAVFQSYIAETGRPISEQEYGGEIAKIKAMIDSGNTTLDVIDVDAPTLLQGCDEGIFEGSVAKISLLLDLGRILLGEIFDERFQVAPFSGRGDFVGSALVLPLRGELP